MAELDDQLARLAAHRAEAMPALDPAVARVRARRAARRRTTWIAAVAACVAALLVVGAFAVFAGSEDPPSVQTPAATTGSTAPPAGQATCAPLPGASGDGKHGPSVPGAPDPRYADARIGMQASDCVDDVVFSFGRSTPAWSISYEPGPLTKDASGLGEEPPGTSWYLIRFPGLPADALYDIGDEARAIAPSEVTAVERVPQADGSVGWAIGLEQQRPFRVVADKGVLRVQFVRATPAVRTCTNTARHFAYDVPAGWFVEVTASGSACAYVAPSAFLMCGGNCDGPIDYGAVVVSPAGAPGGFGDAGVRTSTDTTVAGRPATVRELDATTASLFPVGSRIAEYSVDWSPDGVLDLWIGGDPGPDFDARKAGLDAIAASVRHVD